MTTAAKKTTKIAAKKIVRRKSKEDTIFKSKSEIMKERQLKPIEVVPVSKTHSIYLAIQANPGITIEKLYEALPDLTSSMISTSVNSLFNQGYLKRTATGEKNQLGNPTHFYRVGDSEYTPRAVARKVAPNDKKAMKSIARKQAVKKAEPETKVQPVQFEMIQGVISVTPTDPHFEEITRNLVKDVTPVHVEPIDTKKKAETNIFVDLGPGESYAWTPQKAYMIWAELNAIFGKKD